MRKDTVPYNTNLAAEFWVLSALYRFGVEAHLTLGNKTADNIKVLNNPNHFYIFLSFEGKISDPLASPSVWIIPSNQLEPFIKPYKTRVVVSRALVKRDGSKFKNAWQYFSYLADAESPPISTQ